MIENAQALPSFSEKLASKDQHLLSFRYVTEPGADGKLIFFFPGIGGNMRGQERTMRRIKNENNGSVKYNALTTSLSNIDKPFTTSTIAQEVVQAMDQYQPKRVIFYGSSFGAGCAIATAQYIEANRLPVQLDAIFALMPCINDTNIRLNNLVVPLIKSLPEPLAIAMVRGLYLSRDTVAKLNNDEVEKIESMDTQYRTIVSIPSRSYDPIPPVPVYAYFSPQDKAINNKFSLQDLESIAGKEKVFASELTVTGVRNHNFNPGEFEVAATQHFLPTISHVWAQ